MVVLSLRACGAQAQGMLVCGVGTAHATHQHTLTERGNEWSVINNLTSVGSLCALYTDL